MQSLTSDRKLTPMMEQYRSIKKTVPKETILFFRLGDFYEMFFEDAVQGSEILGITLTGRDAGAAGRVPMCGIPYHAFHQYVRILLDRNLKVAICEQIGDPQNSKGLVERRVTRILSPATYLEDDSSRTRPEYLAAFTRDRNRCALAALDLGTGEFFVREISPDRLSHEWSVLSPREIILPQSAAEETALIRFLKEQLRASLTFYEDWIFQPEEGKRFLQEGFSLASERGLAVASHPLAVGAAGAILYYLKDHLHSALGHIQPPKFCESNEFMTLDRQTLKNLELVSSLNEADRSGHLLNCIDQTVTPMGGRTLYHWVTHPLLVADDIRARQQAVAEWVSQPARLQRLQAAFKGIRDVERTLSRLHYGVANARDLLALKDFLSRLPEIRKICSESHTAFLKKLFGKLVFPPESEGLIARAIVDNPPMTLKEGDLIREGFSEELDRLRSVASKGKLWLVEFQQKEIERTGIKSLRIKYSQVFGYSIEVSTPNLHLVPPDYVRRQTLANAERFVVPELQRWDEQISGAQEKIKAVEFQLFQEIRTQILSSLSSLQSAAQAVGILDCAASLAFTAVRKKWVCPTVTDSREIRIQAGRHPVVESILPAGQFVENDTFLDDGAHQLVLLTGPNMAGKSTFLRQVAQIVLLAQTGSFVPAASAEIGLVDRIFTRIGAHDDLARGESTFMVEMIEMAQILQMATEKSLLILDEVGRGTSTFDGVSLAWAICEHLVQGIRPRTLFATHYHELTGLEDQFPGIINYTMAVKETSEGIIFLRKVAQGRADRSYGIHVAQLAGIPKKVIDRATQILGTLEGGR